ncbi:MAG: helicase RepA family protein [Clostridiales bacterium]|nr:helicase RepA family protein [Clostridiales bacterium]
MKAMGAAQPQYDSSIGLHTITMTELFDIAFPPKTPLIDGLLYSGTYLFAGSPKIGKSFFMMQLAYHVAMGIPLWNYPVRQGTVLYLALEDDYARLQSRLVQMFGVESTPNLVMTTQSRTLIGGLIEQMERFMQRNTDTRLIIVDTLQKVREIGGEAYSYAADYQSITELKSFTDRHNICVLIVHHTRKMEASDSFDMISGTNGLLGAADGAIILQKKKRVENTAKMMIVGRDQEDQELTLEFDREHCFWKLTRTEKELFKRKTDPLLLAVAEFMRERREWTGSATELLELMPDTQLKPQALTRKLNVSVSVLYNEFGISYTQNSRSRDKRTFTLKKVDEEDDGSFADDAIS